MSFAELLAALTWRDFVDFVLLYIVAYVALRLLEGTRAVPVLIFVALLAAAGWAAQELDIVGVGMLLESVLEYIILILIVVFHQELRRMLVQVGRRLMPQSRREAAVSAVDALVAACERLQGAGIGALVILEGEFDVLEACSGQGTTIDAPLQAETLVALLVPHAVNTTHDGAVLVRNFRIARAGVVCPLSEQGLAPRFGTRHRGALGISEDSDALAIVVSEERGELCVAEAGELSEALDRAGLEARIAAWLDRPRDDEPRAGRSMSASLSMAGALGGTAEEPEPPEDSAELDGGRDAPASPGASEVGRGA